MHDKSWFWSPGCEAVDTFTVNWDNELNWSVPPLHLILSDHLPCCAV